MGIEEIIALAGLAASLVQKLQAEGRAQATAAEQQQLLDAINAGKAADAQWDADEKTAEGEGMKGGAS